jgi:hypothetical protein
MKIPRLVAALTLAVVALAAAARTYALLAGLRQDRREGPRRFDVMARDSVR